MVAPTGNDDYYDDDGFQNYIPTTVDPGHWLFFAVCIYSVICVILVPIIVFFGKKRQEAKRKVFECKLNNDDKDEGSITYLASPESSWEVDHDNGNNEIAVIDMTDIKHNAKKLSSPSKESHEEDAASDIDGSLVSAAMSAISKHSGISIHSYSSRSRTGRSRRGRRITRIARNARAMKQETYLPESMQSYEMTPTKNGGVRIDDSFRGKDGVVIDDILPEDAPDHNDPGQESKFVDEQETQVTSLCCGKNALFSCKNIGNSINRLIYIANLDSESRRILHLGIPFTMSTLSKAVFDAITTALISNYLGVKSLSAYVVVNLLIELSTLISGGLVESVDTICAHAIGAENYKLAGQYVQISTVLYIGLSIPIFILWYFVMGDCIRLFGFGDDVVAIGEQYTRIVVFDYIMDGIASAYTELLDMTGYATQGMIFDVVTGSIDILAVWLLLAFAPGMSLFWVGATHLIGTVVCFIVFTSMCICLGWLDPFLEGMVHTFAFKNTAAVKHVIKTSIPLALGSFLEYGEYEVLIFFVAALGPAEVAAWGIIESLWDIFEATTQGVMEAGAMRLAFHLGKGDINKSSSSAWKTLFLSTVLGVFITAILFICGEDLPTWFTKDETLQDMVNSVIPIIGIGNVLMVFGMVSWELVCAQGRFKIATSISAAMSFCITLPLSALFCFYFRFELKGIVSAIVIGYSTTGLAFAVTLLLSDWKKVSDIIIQQNAEESDSDDDEVSSSSSSSSSEGSSSYVESPKKQSERTRKSISPERDEGGDCMLVIPSGSVS